MLRWKRQHTYTEEITMHAVAVRSARNFNDKSIYWEPQSTYCIHPTAHNNKRYRWGNFQSSCMPLQRCCRPNKTLIEECFFFTNINVQLCKRDTKKKCFFLNKKIRLKVCIKYFQQCYGFVESLSQVDDGDSLHCTHTLFRRWCSSSSEFARFIIRSFMTGVSLFFLIFFFQLRQNDRPKPSIKFRVEMAKIFACFWVAVK